MKIPTEILIAVERKACLDSYYDFFLSFWDELVQEELKLNWHIKYMCDELQYISKFIFERKKKPYDLIFNVPPGSTKTTNILQAFPAWLWAKDPTLRIISSSHSADLSNKSSVKSRDLVLSARYKALFPEVVLRQDSQSKSVYTTTKGGNRHTASTTGSTTGDHAHIKLMDDLQEISKAGSEPHREQATAHMKMLFTREVEKGNSVNILIMQRLHEMDATAYLLGLSSKRKVKHICLPARLSEKVNPPELKKMYVNGLLDPIRMSEEVLEEKEIELGVYDFQCQFMQEATPPEGGMIKRKWFKFMAKESFLLGSSTVHFFVDTAYEKKKKNNDPTGLLAVAEQSGIVYILDYREVWMEITELTPFIESWVTATDGDQNSMVNIEPKASGKSTVQVLRDGTNLNVCEIEGKKDSKETELRNSAPAIQSGRFVLLKGGWNELFLSRVCGFPNAKHDEAVDLLCYARKFYLENDSEGEQQAMDDAAGW